MKRGLFQNTHTVLFVVLLVVIAYFVIGPFLMLLYGSLTSKPPGVPGEFTLEHYRTVYGDVRTWRLLLVSLVYASGSSLIAFVVGTFLAWTVERTNMPGRQLIGQLALAPVFLPTVLLTLSWAMLANPESGLLNAWFGRLLGNDRLFNVYTLAGMIWVKGTVDVPLVYLWLSPALKSMDPTLEEAAAASGASNLRILRDVTLPLITPALAATWLITFVLAIEDIAVPIFLGLPARIIVFATEVYLSTARPPTNLNVASTYAVVLMAISLLGIVLYRRATLASERYAVISGKAYRPRVMDLGRARYLMAALAAFLVVVIVGLPALTMLWNSFMPYPQGPSAEALKVLTLDNYRETMASRSLLRSFQNSTLLGLGTGVLVMFVASLVAWVVMRTKVRFRELIDFLAFVPVAIPGVVVGVSLIWMYLVLPIPIYATKWILLVAYFTRFIPYGTRLSYAGQAQIHPELEEASSASGASWFRTFARVTLPLLSPTLFGGVSYVLVRAFRELPTSILLSHRGSEVFSTAVYSLWEVGALTRLSAYGVIAVIILMVSVFVIRKVTTYFGVST